VWFTALALCIGNLSDISQLLSMLGIGTYYDNTMIRMGGIISDKTMINQENVRILYEDAEAAERVRGL
jgi:hypothetical protein